MATSTNGKVQHEVENSAEPEMDSNVLRVHRRKRHSKSRKAELVFPVSRVYRYLRRGRYANRISSGASVYLTAVLEYLSAEILELAGNAARDNKRMNIIPRHIQLAVRNDDELDELLSHVVIANGGVLPFLHSALLPKVTKKKVKNDD